MFGKWNLDKKHFVQEIYREKIDFFERNWAKAV